MCGTKCPTVRSGGTISVRSALMPMVMMSRASMGFDLDDDGVGIDAEVLHQRLRDVAHHAGLLFVGAAGGHADGDFRHFCHSLCVCCFLLATNSNLILRSRASRGVSKDVPIVPMVR